MSIDLTLDRIRRLSLHLPPYTRPTCHVVGTNGKGSVSALLSSIFTASEPPLSVGRFNSPHLVSIHDCIAINNESISAHAYSSARSTVEEAAAEHGVDVSSFELLTLTALLLFEQAKVDVVVLEAGMGGRLDATNVISDNVVLVSALAAVDFDHQAFLGDSIAAITREKASIARRGKPFVLGAQKHPEVEEVARSVVAEAKGEFFLAGRVLTREWDTLTDGPERLLLSLSAQVFQPPPPQPVQARMSCFSQNLCALLPLYGEHQRDNLGLALSIISTLLTHPSCKLVLRDRVTLESVARGVQSVRWPGRLSFHTWDVRLEPSVKGKERERLVILADGAHNSASSATLAKYITHTLSNATPSHGSAPTPHRTISLTYILALSHSPPKTPLQTLTPLLPPSVSQLPDVSVKINVALLRFSPPEGMPWVKSVPPQDLRAVVRELVSDADIWVGEDESSDELSRALEWAGKKSRSDGGEGLVVVAGSLYLVADLYRILGV